MPLCFPTLHIISARIIMNVLCRVVFSSYGMQTKEPRLLLREAAVHEGWPISVVGSVLPRSLWNTQWAGTQKPCPLCCAQDSAQCLVSASGPQCCLMNMC